jgi:hypothetical protein
MGGGLKGFQFFLSCYILESSHSTSSSAPAFQFFLSCYQLLGAGLIALSAATFNSFSVATLRLSWRAAL